MAQAYIPKTTLIEITCGWWSEKTPAVHNLQMEAVRAAAQHIAQRCHMDLMSFSYIPDEHFYSSAIVVYVNNGASLTDIKHFMASEVDQKGKAFWFLQDIEERANGLDFILAARPMNEGWE